MERLTQPGPQEAEYSVPQEHLPAAIQRLALFENLVEKVLTEQEDLAQRLEKLRLDGKKNSVKFKELLGKKLQNSYVLLLLEMNGLK